MATAAQENNRADLSVPEVYYSNVPARGPSSPPLDADEVRDMHVMLKRVFGHHPDGYATSLPGFQREFC